MRTRIVLVLILVGLFWVAPRPSTTQAKGHREIMTSSVVSPDNTTSGQIVIVPYVKPVK